MLPHPRIGPTVCRHAGGGFTLDVPVLRPDGSATVLSYPLTAPEAITLAGDLLTAAAPELRAKPPESRPLAASDGA